ncbi:MAG: serine protease, partial [Paracoccaceae bacterium]
NFAGRNFCTGAMIAPDLVLTAAHCLFDKETGRAFAASEIQFLAGFRNGRANADRGVKRAIAHPEFEFAGGDKISRVAFDLALLQLDRPVRNFSVTPFETQERPRNGAQVGVVSYGHDRAQSAALQEACYVLARRSGTLVLSCDVDFGSSGAPVFSIDEAGVARIVSVISAKAEVNGREVALATSLEKPLGDLMALMANAQGAPVEPSVNIMTLSGSSDGSGAKFLRP